MVASEGAAELMASARDWLADDPDPITREELAEIIESGDIAELTDRFSGLLSFGTAGLRGAVGAGPNRMNLAVVIRAASGVASWVADSGDGGDGVDRQRSVAVSFDARHRSRDFAEVTAEVLAAAGIRALVLPGPLPTPVLAFAVTRLGADAGVMVTASHNPPQDNGYKVYDGSGRQIVSPTDSYVANVMASIERVSLVSRTGPDDPDIVRLGPEIVDAYVAAAARLATPGGPRAVRLGYTAMHGVGAAMFRRVMADAGFDPAIEVAEQVEPDPGFPTVSFPNPEEPGALDLGLAVAREHHLDLLLANDPDADRLGAALADPTMGDPAEPAGWKVLRGDEIGVLLAHHLLSTGRVAASETGLRGVLVSTIVSSTLLSKMAEAAGVRHVETLTGFKWISRGPGEGEYLAFGYEEALGYCVGGVADDKDGITAALVLAEMAAQLKPEGRTLVDVLDDLARVHGLHQTSQWTARVDGSDAMAKLAGAMTSLRTSPPTSLAGRPVIGVVDLIDGDAARGFVPSDVITLNLEGARVVVRPSGTEPKLKCYLEVVEPVNVDQPVGDARERAKRALDALTRDVAALIQI